MLESRLESLIPSPSFFHLATDSERNLKNFLVIPEGLRYNWGTSISGLLSRHLYTERLAHASATILNMFSLQILR